MFLSFRNQLRALCLYGLSVPLFLFSQDLNWDWANRVVNADNPSQSPSRAPEQVLVVEHDAAGNLYAVLYHHGITEVGGQDNTSQQIGSVAGAFADGYSLAKYDSAGKLLWVFLLNHDQRSQLREMKVSSGGDITIVWNSSLLNPLPPPAPPQLPLVFAVGSVTGSQAVFGLPLYGSGTAAIVTVFDPDGNYVDGKLISARDNGTVTPEGARWHLFNMQAEALALAPDGTTLMGGQYQDSLYLDGGIYPMPVLYFINSLGQPGVTRKLGAFWIRLDSTLATIQYEPIFPGGLPSSGKHYARVWELGTDNAGNIFALTYATGQNSWDGVSIYVDTALVNSRNVFVLSKYTPGGQYTWGNVINSFLPVVGAPYRGNMLAVDGLGHAYVRTLALGGLTVDGQAIQTPPETYGAVAFVKFGPAGGVQHSVFGSAQGVFPGIPGFVSWGAMDLDADHNLYVAGILELSRIFQGTDSLPVVMTSDGGEYNVSPQANRYNVFVARYAPDGRLLGLQKGGGRAGHSVPLSIAAGPDGQVAVGGHFSQDRALFGKYLLEGAPYANQGVNYAGGFIAHLKGIRVVVSEDSLLYGSNDYVKVRKTTQISYCGGDTVVYLFKTLNYRSPGNRFVLQMSDSAGVFGPSPLVLDSIETDQYLDSIVAVIPFGLKRSDYYRFRVVCRNNALVGTSERARAITELEVNGAIYENYPPVPIQQNGTVLSVACPFNGGCKVYWYRGTYQNFQQVGNIFGNDFTYTPSFPGTYWAEIVGVNQSTCVIRTPLFTYPATTPVDPDLAAAFGIYPNPGQDELVLHLSDPGGLHFTCEWIDSQGRRVLLQQGRTQAPRLDVSSLPAGIYRISVRVDGVWQGMQTWVKSGQ